MSETSKRRRIVRNQQDSWPFDRLPYADFNKIPLIGFGTFGVINPMVIFNALSVGYRHLDLAESYNNLQHVRQGLSLAFAPLSEGGLGIERQDVWLTMKIPVKSIDNINTLLAAVGTDYFDLLLYHFPGSMCDSEAELKASWGQMTDQPKSVVRRIGVSNFYAPQLTRLLDVCEQFDFEKPFANEIQINPYVYHLEKNTMDLCFIYGIQLIAYSPLGFHASRLILEDDTLQSIAGHIGISAAQLTLAWLLSKSICVIPKSNSKSRQEENFASKDAIYSVLSFSAEMDKISEDKDSSCFLLDTATKAKEDGDKLIWN